MKKKEKILILGSSGLVGSSLARELKKQEYKNLLTPSKNELNLMKQKDVLDYFLENRPLYIFNAAGKVGGILANKNYPADFIFQNLTIQNNVFEAAYKTKVKRLLFMGSSCIYPKNCPQPIKEEYLLTGELEPTNESFAVAKIAGLKTAESFRYQYGCDFFCVMPTNLYGPSEHLEMENSHVIPGIIQRLNKILKSDEKKFEVWGSGKPRREFLYVDDLSRACIILMQSNKLLPNIINIGTGEDISIAELALIICDLMGFKGEIVYNMNFPDGTMKKILDISKIQEFGWKHKINLHEGLKITIEHFLKNRKENFKAI